jgi:hypothetical protein
MHPLCAHLGHQIQPPVSETIAGYRRHFDPKTAFNPERKRLASVNIKSG